MLSAKDKLYTCSECLKGFRSEQNLREHLRTHTGERPYKCRICDKTFKTSGTRCRHERGHEGGHESLRKLAKPVAIVKNTYACTRCSKEFSNVVDRGKHMKESHKLSGQYFCLQCNIELSTLEDLVGHHSSEHSSEVSVQPTSQDPSFANEHQDHAHQDHAYQDQAYQDHAQDHAYQDHAYQDRAHQDHAYQDHAYHRAPLNSMNVNSHDSLVEKESHINTSRNSVKNSSECLEQSLVELGYMQFAGTQRNLDTVDHVCKYCEKVFSTLPVFLKHLLKHSEAKTEVKSEPSTVKSEFFADDSDVAVENAVVDSGGQSVMMSCRSSPVLVKNECESETLYLAELETKSDLQNLVDEITLHEIDSKIQDFERNVSDEIANLSSRCAMSRKQTKRETQTKQRRQKSNQHFNSDSSEVHDESRISDLSLCDDESKPVNGYCQENGETETERNLEDERLSLLERSECILDGNKNHIFCKQCGGKLKASSKDSYTCATCAESFPTIQTTEDGDSVTIISLPDIDISKRKSSRRPRSAKTSYNCKHCNMKFKTKKLFNLHKRTHTISNRVKSEACDESTPKPSDVSEHKSNAADKEPFSCTVCGRRFAVKYRLHRHMIIHTGEKPFVCNECGKAFTTNAYLKSHVARHTTDLTYLCSTCGKRFADRIAWRYHKRVHDIAQRTNSHSFKEHICWVCGFQFNRASNLARHELKHRSSEEHLLVCDECGRKFRTKEGYRYHVGQHAVDKPYLCMDCPKVFADAFCLKTHLKLHAQQGSFECGVCGKKYRTMFILKMHAKHHTDKRYSCDVCGETFGFARQFRSHLIKHRPPFQCDVCGVTTTRAADMRKHKKRFQH